jgi:hypothetical protein
VKWFKYNTDAFMSEGIDALMDAEGFAGYGRWVRLLEIVAYKMDETTRCHAEYSIQKWCRLLGLKQKKLISFLELTENQLKTKVVYSGNIIRIEIPNLLKKRDNYTKDLEATSKRLPSKEVEVEVDKEEKKDTKKTKAPLPKGFKISDRVSVWAEKKKYSQLEEHLENFKLQASARGYKYADWDSAFMTAIRDDWAGINNDKKFKPKGWL